MNKEKVSKLIVEKGCSDFSLFEPEDRNWELVLCKSPESGLIFLNVVEDRGKYLISCLGCVDHSKFELKE